MGPRSDSHWEHARALVLAHGWNATAYQTLNPGIERWFAAAGDAAIGYVDWAGVRIVAGAPICAAARQDAVIAEFEAAAAGAGRQVCYFGAGERLERTLAARGAAARILLGAQPVWRPERLADTMQERATLRAQLHRARNKRVIVSEWSMALDAAAQAQLERLLREWLATRGLPALHFLVEPDTLSRLVDRRLFVAARDGAPVGFLVASPIPQRRGWLIEQIVRGRFAPNGTSETLLFSAARAMTDAGDAYVTLGLAPLSRRAAIAPPEAPMWLRALLAWVRAHGRRFYNFEGLDTFKAKFQPERWEPIYLIAPARRITPRMVYAVAGAFGARAPLLTLGSAVARAAGHELRTAVRAASRLPSHFPPHPLSPARRHGAHAESPLGRRTEKVDPRPT